MHEIFISYSTEDKAVADAICHKFEAGGLRCWYAPRDVAPGSIWQESLMNAIQETKVFLLIYSKDYNKSAQVLNELTAAVNANCFVVPFRIDQTDMSKAFAYYLNSVHWLDAVNPPTEQQIDILYGHICGILQKKPPKNPEPVLETAPVVPPVQPAQSSTKIVSQNTPAKKNQPQIPKWVFGLSAAVILVVGLLVFAITQIAPLFNKLDNLLSAQDQPAASEQADKETVEDHNGSSGETVTEEETDPEGQETASAQDPSVQRINLLGLSDVGSYRYPFYATNMISQDFEMFCVLNTEEETLTIARTDNGNIFLSGIENVFEFPLFVNMLYEDGHDTIYFLESVSSSEYLLRLYSVSDEDWIEKDGFSIQVLPSEYIAQTANYSQSMISGNDHTEELVIFIFDDASDAGCFSRVIHVYPDGRIEENDILSFGLETLLSGIDSPTDDYALFLDRNHTLKVYDHNANTVLDLTHQEIVEEFMPLTQDELTNISPDKRYLYTSEDSTAYVWDLVTGKVAYQHTFTSGFNGRFRNETQIVFYDSADDAVFLYDLQNERIQYLLKKAFFEDNPAFLSVPYDVTYFQELDALCCVSYRDYDAETGTSTDMVTIVDLDGNVLAVSDELETNLGDNYVDAYLHDTMLFLDFHATRSFEHAEDGIYTRIFRALYTKDDQGNIVFSEDEFL